MPDSYLVSLARQFATKHGINQALVCAICEQESSWNPSAQRYEPAFQKRYINPLVDIGKVLEEDAVALSTSWGLMQLMGETAREHGLAGPPQQLMDPATGLEWGCLVFSKMLIHSNGDAYNALLRWNGGMNLAYPTQVIDRMDKYLEPAIDLNASDL